MEGSSHGHGEHTFRAELLGDRGQLRERLGGAGDYHLTWRVEVRDPRLAVHPATGGLDCLVVEPEHGHHGPGRELGGFAHRRTPFGHEPQPVFEVERACCHERRVLAQAVPGRSRGFDAEAFGGIEDDEALDEGGDLGVVGLGQGLLVGFEQEMGKVASGDLRGELDQLEGGVVDPGRAHAGSLRALAGKRERQQLRPFPLLVGRPLATPCVDLLPPLSLTSALAEGLHPRRREAQPKASRARSGRWSDLPTAAVPPESALTARVRKMWSIWLWARQLG